MRPNVLYYSTRKNPLEDKGKTFTQVVLEGIADDGGLFVPYPLPKINLNTQHSWRKLPYRELCFEVLRCFVTSAELNDKTLHNIIYNAYKKFTIPECVSVKRVPHVAKQPFQQPLLTEMYLVELFHGPSLAFKDFGLQFLAQVLLHLLPKSQKESLVLVATSGDTGAAAVSSFEFMEGIKCVVLYPAGKVSHVQELQMTSTTASNIYCIAIQDASFNDCQNYVKQLLNSPLRQRFNLLCVNSINWGRLVAQIVYYWYAVFRILENQTLCHPIDICVPTGNFGNIMAAYYAKQMGAPIRHCIIASNINGKFTQLLSTGVYCAGSGCVTTLSPAMDIETASNFERLLFLLLDFNGSRVSSMYRRESAVVLDQLMDLGYFTLEESKALHKLRQDFSAYRITDEETRDVISLLFFETQSSHPHQPFLLDPHTAVGYATALKYIQESESHSYKSPNPFYHHYLLIISTAHVCKFTELLASTLAEFHPNSFIIPEPVQRLLSKTISRRYTSENDMSCVIKALENFLIS